MIVISIHKAEAEREGHDEGEVGEKNEGVAPEDGGEHVDVEGDGGVGHDLDEQEVELHEGEQEGEGCQVLLHHLALSKGDPLLR